MTRSRIQVWLSGAAITLGTTAYAAPEFDVTFTGDTPGGSPTTDAPVAGGVSTHVTNAGAGAGNSVLIQNTYTDTMTGEVFGDGNVAVFTDTSGSASTFALLQGDPADEIGSGVFTVSFDWIEDKGIAGSSSFFIVLTNQARSKNLSAIFLDLGNDVGNIRSGNSVNFGGSLGSAARGVSHHIDWVVDLDETDFTISSKIYLDGVFLHDQQRDPIGGPHDGASAFGNVTIAGSNPAVGVLAFDNLRVQAGDATIPEPAGLALVAAGLVAMLSRRRQA